MFITKVDVEGVFSGTLFEWIPSTERDGGRVVGDGAECFEGRLNRFGLILLVKNIWTKLYK